MRVDGSRSRGPADGALAETAAVFRSGVLDERDDARVVRREDFGWPEGLGVSPVGAHLFPTGWEVRKTGAFPGGVDRRAVVGCFGLENGRRVVPAEGARRVRGAEEAPEIPEVVAHDVVFAIPEVFAVGRRGR